MVPKIEVTRLGDHTCNVGYKTGSITYEFETKTFNYDRGYQQEHHNSKKAISRFRYHGVEGLRRAAALESMVRGVVLHGGTSIAKMSYAIGGETGESHYPAEADRH